MDLKVLNGVGVTLDESPEVPATIITSQWYRGRVRLLVRLGDRLLYVDAATVLIDEKWCSMLSIDQEQAEQYRDEQIEEHDSEDTVP